MMFAVTSAQWTTAAAVATALGGILTGILAYLRNKKTDKLALYSQFVDDLHQEVDRLRRQYDEDRTRYETDRKAWLTRETELTSEVDALKAARSRRRPPGREGGK